MNRPTIKMALSGSLSLVAIALIGFATVALSSMSTLTSNSAQVAETLLPEITLSKEMETTLSDLGRAYLDHILAADDAARQMSRHPSLRILPGFKTSSAAMSVLPILQPSGVR